MRTSLYRALHVGHENGSGGGVSWGPGMPRKVIQDARSVRFCPHTTTANGATLSKVWRAIAASIASLRGLPAPRATSHGGIADRKNRSVAIQGSPGIRLLCW